jgi:hypothetical protein
LGNGALQITYLYYDDDSDGDYDDDSDGDYDNEINDDDDLN